MSVIYRYRDGLASGPALLMLVTLPLLLARPSPVPSLPPHEPIKIVLIAPEAEAPPPQPHPPVPQPEMQPAAQLSSAHAVPTTGTTGQTEKVKSPTPVPEPTVKTPLPVRAPPSLTHPPEPKPVEQPVARPRPALEVPTSTAESGEVKLPAPSAPESTGETPLPDPPGTQPPLPTSLPQPAPQTRRANPDAELEAAYVAQVRQMLNAIKRYPTGREASLLRPSGTVRIWLVLDRNGQLLDRGIEISSQSLLLDNAALKTVSFGSYPPFPEELWPGQAQHRFHVDIDFIVPSD